MTQRRSPTESVSLLVLFSLALVSVALAQDSRILPYAKNAPENLVVGLIKKMSEPEPQRLSIDLEIELQASEKQQLLAAIADLEERFPKSDFLSEAKVIKLKTLAELARVDSAYLDLLLLETRAIAGSDPAKELSAQNDFYAIQAFVLGARRENMPEKRQHLGLLERYEAFLQDHPESEHVPTLWASLIRTALRLDRPLYAQEQLTKFRERYPNHPAYRRANGEVRRVFALGTQWGFEYETPDGKKIDTRQFKGEVLIVHFWASWSPDSLEQLTLLRDLNVKYRDKGLRIVGVNIDRSKKLMDEAMRRYGVDWPQYYDERGLKNALFVDAGVVGIPTVYLVDRQQVLRAIDPEGDLEQRVKTLLAEPVPPGS